MTALDEKSFLVRVGVDGYFFTAYGAGPDDPLGSRILSEAEHLSYAEADSLAQALRNYNFAATVCDRFGEPITAESLRKYSTASTMITQTDLNRMGKWVLRRRVYTEPAFREYLDASFASGALEKPEHYPVTTHG